MSYVTKSNTVIYFIISVLLVFLCILGGQFIADVNLKFAYYMLFLLLFVSFSNIYVLKLENNWMRIHLTKWTYERWIVNCILYFKKHQTYQIRALQIHFVADAK